LFAAVFVALRIAALFAAVFVALRPAGVFAPVLFATVLFAAVLFTTTPSSRKSVTLLLHLGPFVPSS